MPFVIYMLKLADVVIANLLIGLQMLFGDIVLLVIIRLQAIPDGAFIGKCMDCIGHPIKKRLDGRATECQNGIFGEACIRRAHRKHRLMNEALNRRKF
jgi:hypothetical protein